MRRLGLSLALLCACTANAASEEERRSQHIGPVHAALSHAKSLAVATDAGVLASINARTGDQVWRTVYARSQKLLASALGKSHVAALIVEDDELRVQLRNAVDGSLQWDRVVGQAAAVEGWAPNSVVLAGATVAAVHQGSLTLLSAQSGVIISTWKNSSSAVYVGVDVHEGAQVVAARVPAWRGDHATATSLDLVSIDATGTGTQKAVSFSFYEQDAPIEPVSVSLLPHAQGSMALGVSPSGSHLHLLCNSGAGGKGSALVTAANLASKLSSEYPRPAGDARLLSVQRLAVAGAVVTDGGAAAASSGAAGATWSLAAATYTDGTTVYLRVLTSSSSCNADVLTAAYSAQARGSESAVAAGAALVDGALHAVVAATSSKHGLNFAVINAATGGVQEGAQGAESEVSADPNMLRGVPADKLGTATHGLPSRIFPLPFARQDGKHGWRVLVVAADGFTTVLQNGNAVWSRTEGGACVGQALPVDIPRRAYTTQEDASSPAKDPSLQFGNRLVSQAGYLASKLGGIRDGLLALPEVGFQGLPALLGLQPAVIPGQMSPLRGGFLDKVVVMRSRTDGTACTCSAGSSAAGGVLGSLSAAYVESGRVLWTMSLPISSAVHTAMVPDKKSGRKSAGIAAADYHVTLLQSRSRPIQSHHTEVLVLESARTHEGKYLVVLSWVDVQTGRVSAVSSYTAASALDRVVRTPVFHRASQRDTYALQHADGHAVVAPGSDDVVAALKGLAGDFAFAGLTYEAATDAEQLAGWQLSWPSQSAQGAISRHAHEPGTPGVHHIPLAVASSSLLWTLTVAADIGSRGEHVLAFDAVSGDSVSGAGAVPSAHADANTDSLLAEAVEDSGHPMAVSSGVQILGDDSLLLKYTNPHVLAVVVGESGPTQSGFERARLAARTKARHAAGLPVASPAAGSVASNLTLLLVDAVTGRVLHTRRHVSAVGPTAVAMFEHWTVYTMWNARAKRAEVATAACYEGVIETYELTPWSRSKHAQRSPVLSSYAPQLPIVAHKSFILPSSAHTISVTRTHAGITTPNVLVGTTGDGVLSIERRWLDPRRPVNEPKDTEKAERLEQYNPYLPMRASWLLTREKPVAGMFSVASAPSSFESTTYVIALGIDHFFGRYAPARAFDQLDPEALNVPGFLAVLLAGTGIALALRGVVKRKTLSSAWK